jgi:hypothetical protein
VLDIGEDLQAFRESTKDYSPLVSRSLFTELLVVLVVTSFPIETLSSDRQSGNESSAYLKLQYQILDYPASG